MVPNLLREIASRWSDRHHPAWYQRLL